MIEKDKENKQNDQDVVVISSITPSDEVEKSVSPIPVAIVSDPNQTTGHLNELHKITKTLKEASEGIIKNRPNKVWDWINKHSFQMIFFIGVGIIAGIIIANWLNNCEMRKAINLGSFEFEGYIFNVEHSARPKFFNGDKPITAFIPVTKPNEQKEEQPIPEPVPAKKGK